MRWYPERFFTYSRRLSLAVVTLAAAGCAGWVGIPAPAPTVLPSRMELQLWQGGRATVLREVIIDSIRGLRVEVVRRPTGTRVVLARSTVDSVRMRPGDPQNWLGVGVLAGALGGIVVTTTVFRGALGD